MTLSAYSANETARRSITVRAYDSLDGVHRSVLWYLDVERLPLDEVCKIMGMPPFEVVGAAAQARYDLRTAWVFEQMHCERTPEVCKGITVSTFLASNALNSEYDLESRRSHLDTCIRCSILSSELNNLPLHLRTALFPFVLGPTRPGTLADIE